MIHKVNPGFRFHQLFLQKEPISFRFPDHYARPITNKMRSANIVFLLEASASYGLSIGETVQTSSGPVSGHPATLNNNVSTYLGIPYALPPVGNLRFMPPVKYSGSTAINGSNMVSLLPSSTFMKVDSVLHSRDSLVQPLHLSLHAGTISTISMFPLRI
jgi:Carboxylesterase family